MEVKKIIKKHKFYNLEYLAGLTLDLERTLIKKKLNIKSLIKIIN